MAARAVALSSLSRRALAGIPFSGRLSASLQPPSACCSTSSSSATEFLLGSHQLVRRRFSCTSKGGVGKMLKVRTKLDAADGPPPVAEKELELASAADPVVEAPPSLGLTKAATRSFPEVVVGIKPIDVTEWKGDILAIGVFEGEVETEEDGSFKHPGLKRVDGFLGGIVADLVKEEEFTGKAGSSAFLRLSGYGFKKVGVVGLGKLDDVKTSTWKGFGEAIASATKTKASVGAFILSGKELSEDVQIAAAGGIVSGLLLEQYKDTRFKSESKDPPPITLDILGGGDEKAFEKTLLHVTSSANGVVLAKQLVNAPANVLTPGMLAEEAKKIGAAHSDVLTVKVLDQAECAKLNMGAYLGVAAASSNPPAFIHIQYKPQGTVHTKLAIIGKGLTFDSGGYNLKTGAGSLIELMKFDMGGAAAAFGAAKAIASIQPPGVEVNFIVAACENMISGDGMRPGDILTASNGKTIEVNNTDAEGRLTLADALVYAGNLGVDKIVDLATLTGAIIVALGSSIGGLFTKHDELAQELDTASKIAGEKFWRLPMEESYWEGMKSGIADMVNTGGRYGGSITAALFLSQFVDKDTPWAHLDIAGPVWNDKKGGGTGFAVSTLVEWVVKHSSPPPS